MNIIARTQSGRIVHGDNLEVLNRLQENFADSCISDFPYGIDFMGKKWDSGNTFYDWCLARASALFRVMKPGGYAAIFGHPKKNHRMKCAFEDAGFKIVEEIDWLYMTGMPKNQDIGKLFDKAVGVEREVIGRDLKAFRPNAEKAHKDGQVGAFGLKGSGSGLITAPSTAQAKRWDGWKTAGLKPAHEPITVFQKPLDGTYTKNIEKYGCGGMNIDACRVPISADDADMINAKASKNPTNNYSSLETHVYGKYAVNKATPSNGLGRFPANIILDESAAKLIDEQTGNTVSTGGTGKQSRVNRTKSVYGVYLKTGDYINPSLGGYGDMGGGSRVFPIIKYTPKVSPSERKLPDGERNPHVTLKPVALIQWLIRLLTPLSGVTIDITAGSCTHGVACELLNKDEGYNLTWLNIELQNTQEEPYCNVGKQRVESVLSEQDREITSNLSHSE